MEIGETPLIVPSPAMSGTSQSKKKDRLKKADMTKRANRVERASKKERMGESQETETRLNPSRNRNPRTVYPKE